jgi:hypothetical protein
MRTWLTVVQAAEYAGRLQGHDLHRMRTARNAPRTNRGTPLDSGKAGVDRRVAGTPRARGAAMGNRFRFAASGRMMVERA